MSPTRLGNGAILETRHSTNDTLSHHDARFMDTNNALMETYAQTHDYGYGASSHADLGDSDGWQDDGKNTFRMVNADQKTTMSDDACVNRATPKMWAKFASLPRESLLGSTRSLSRENTCSPTAGMLMTPLREIDENQFDLTKANLQQWTASTMTPNTVSMRGYGTDIPRVRNARKVDESYSVWYSKKSSF